MSTCLLCTCSDSSFIKSERGYHAVRCDSCGLVYIQPRPTLQQLQEIYEQGDTVSLEVGAQIQFTTKKWLIASNDLRAIKTKVPTGYLLEVGCGAGYFLQCARDQGFVCFGIEINKTLVEYARNHLGLNVQPGTLLTAEVPCDTFDVAYLRNVVSHMYDPIGEFLKLNGALRGGGWLFFETGNVPELPVEILQCLDLGLPEHLQFFSRQNIMTLLKKTGFELVSMRSYSIEWHERVRQKFDRQVRRAIRGGGTSSTVSRGYVQRVVGYLSYLISYEVGRIFPKNGHFYTIKYVARKK